MNNRSPFHVRMAFYCIPEPNSGCLLWTGAYNNSGYGKITHECRELSAHRVAWEMQNGPIPNGMMVCHHCDVRECINPAHLYLGTALENNRDAVRRGRRPRQYRRLN